MGLDSKKQLIKEIKKRENVVIRFWKCDLGGYPFVEIRQYKRDKSGVFIPEKKFLTFVPDLLDEIINALIAVKQEFVMGKQ
ncbi:MAG TPA: hypothetical protein VMZ04_08470 [Anaerolineae bacterium]|nr:hypothetical protein [Anaerolineae bacterium]